MKVIMHVPHRFSGIGTPAPLLTRPVATRPGHLASLRYQILRDHRNPLPKAAPTMKFAPDPRF
jgi:hypothetical protein